MALNRVDFLKIDVEGFEQKVLAGAHYTIARDRPIVFVEYRGHYHGDISEQLVATFRPLGYSAWYYVTPLFNADNFRRNPVDILPGFWS